MCPSKESAIFVIALSYKELSSFKIISERFYFRFDLKDLLLKPPGDKS